jgi:hypothetical protein
MRLAIYLNGDEVLRSFTTVDWRRFVTFLHRLALCAYLLAAVPLAAAAVTGRP